jgi:hypothetical protein
MHIAYNVPRTGARNPVLRLRQGYGACALLAFRWFFFIDQITISLLPISNKIRPSGSYLINI